MDNLKLPASPQAIYLEENGHPRAGAEYDWDFSGFTKLEMAALMIAQGAIASGNYKSGDGKTADLAEYSVRTAKAVLEEANK